MPMWIYLLSVLGVFLVTLGLTYAFAPRQREANHGPKASHRSVAGRRAAE